MRDPWDDSELALRFREMGASSLPRAPLNAALSTGIARDPELYRLLFHAPPTQRLPVLLLATAHALVLAEPDDALAAWYPNLTEQPRSSDDPDLMPTFKQFLLDRAPTVMELLSTRSTQTNEVGRCSLLLPPMSSIAAKEGPIALIDVGTSGGLNLYIDQYRFRYVVRDETHVLGPQSPVTLDCTIRGGDLPEDAPLPPSLPEISARIGIDADPIDVTDPAQARWLEACVWPDQSERFHRLRAAIDIAKQSPPEIVAGDAVDLLAPTVARMSEHGHVVVTNSWVLNYFTTEARVAYVRELDQIGTELDISWIFAEAPAMSPGLPWADGLDHLDLTVLSMVRWRSGRRTVDHLATCHPHGFWMQPIRGSGLEELHRTDGV